MGFAPSVAAAFLCWPDHQPAILAKSFGSDKRRTLNVSLLLPSHHTVQMMAKAAVAVYEAAVENRRPED
jgi:hypothetical protein